MDPYLARVPFVKAAGSLWGQVFCNGADKTRGVRIHMQAFIDRHGQNTGRVKQMANKYIEGKADEYSSKRAWSTIGKQYPEGKAER